MPYSALEPYDTENLPDPESPATYHENFDALVTWIVSELVPKSNLNFDWLAGAIGGDTETILDALGTFAIMPIGMPFPVWDHLTGAVVPSNAGTQKFIKLTAGLTGAGQFNEGLLASESVTGSAPLVVATAQIVGGPMTGQTVSLINTEGRYIIAGTTSGVVRMDQMQQITGTLPDNAWGGISGASGAFSRVAGSNSRGATGSGGDNNLSFNSANSPNARTGTDTHGKDISATFYMRVI
ncbi:hypothetical protein [Maritimibacter sp. DP1N21-5]|uniref:hypothetical protein n=1 Tax=Maritimibacter sp. DP1N21-5 TaxID=2836867 RepID=UPI001C460CF3|nr:hypothetical protein [Maritimibacter sp. DP1N21-5]MBV7408209.1 hypothetical protein [Maritimibacter sp. DP1N21-5]